MRINGYQIVSKVVNEIGIIRPIANVAGTIGGAIAGAPLGPLGMVGGMIGGKKVAGALGSGASRVVHSVKPAIKNVLSTPDRMVNAVIPHPLQHEPVGKM